jgi:hypothetical protein
LGGDVEALPSRADRGERPRRGAELGQHRRDPGESAAQGRGRWSAVAGQECEEADVVVGAVVGVAGAPELVPLVTGIVAGTVVLVWVWRISCPQDHRVTELLAEEGRSGVEQDRSRPCRRARTPAR